MRILAAFLAFGLATGAQAQNWPARPISGRRMLPPGCCVAVRTWGSRRTLEVRCPPNCGCSPAGRFERLLAARPASSPTVWHQGKINPARAAGLRIGACAVNTAR